MFILNQLVIYLQLITNFWHNFFCIKKYIIIITTIFINIFIIIVINIIQSSSAGEADLVSQTSEHVSACCSLVAEDLLSNYLVYPLELQYQPTNSPQRPPVISYGTSCDYLLKNQDSLS